MKRSVLIIGLGTIAYFVFTSDSAAVDGRGGTRERGRPPQQSQSPNERHAQHQQRASERNSGASTPSMSRSDPSPKPPQHHGSHPTQGQVQDFLQAQPKPSPLRQQMQSSSLPGKSGSGLTGNAFQQAPSLPGHSGSGLMTPSQIELRQFAKKSIEHRPPPSGQLPPGFSSGFSEQFKRNRSSANRVETTIRQNRPWIFNSFDDNFFHSHNFRPFHHYQGANWWYCPSWGGINTWLGWGWSSPVYYDNSYAYPDSTYDFYSNPEEPPAYVPPAPSNPISVEPEGIMSTTAESNWLPLGVFITGQNASQISFSNIIMQLALSRDGQISGTYYNTATDKTYQIEGFVDKESQQAIWKLSQDPSSPTMSTGIYNLTQDQSTIQVNFPNNIVQTWTLVRLNAVAS